MGVLAGSTPRTARVAIFMRFLTAIYLLFHLCGFFRRASAAPPAVAVDARALRINGTRQLILSGSVHYARVLPSDWERVFLLAKELHLNTIQTYFMWNFHEGTERGNITWKDRADLVQFITLAQQHGLLVNLRIGPYVCGEYYFGGLPLWLRNFENITCFRCSDPVWKKEMARVVHFVVDKVRPLLFQNGGNIVLLQVENEYNGDDRDYLDWAVGMAHNATKKEGALWSLCHDQAMCSNINGDGQSALCTINGFWMDEYTRNPSQPSPKWIHDQQAKNPQQPLVWTEDQGWFDQWKVAKRVRDSGDQMYGILRFIAYGGTWHNHYMLTGGSNFGLQAGGDVVTGYAPDTVIDSFLLRHEPRFTLYKRMYGVLSSQSVSEALLATNVVPKAQIVPTNATSPSGINITASLQSCTDTDPAHIGLLDSSQEWDMLGLQETTTELSYTMLKNYATGLCLSSILSAPCPPSLTTCSNNNEGLLWAFNGSHVQSKTIQKCLSPKEKGNNCHRCLDVNKNGQIGLWDCKRNNVSDDQPSNQWFHVSNHGRGIRDNRTGLCLTATSSNTEGRIEHHAYSNGLSFLSNTDPIKWLKARPFVSLEWERVLAPASVMIVNRSTVPPTVLFNSRTRLPTTATAASPKSIHGKTWEFYLERPGIGAKSASSLNQPLEQLNLTNNAVEHMWYSTEVPSASRSSSPDALDVTGIDSTELSAVTVTNRTIYILSSAMGMRNGGLDPSNGKGISIQGKGPIFDGQSLLGQKWTSTWMIPGEHLRIFDPTTTDLVKWENIGDANNESEVQTAPAAWFRTTVDLPPSSPTTSDAAGKSGRPLQLAYALNLTTMWKGTAYVNGFFLGRYWMAAGLCKGTCAPPVKNGHCYMHWRACEKPTQTLYHIPTSVVKPTGNLIVLFEEVGSAPLGSPLQSSRDVSKVNIVVLNEHPNPKMEMQEAYERNSQDLTIELEQMTAEGRQEVNLNLH